jgi:gliding motility-associated-like protein
MRYCILLLLILCAGMLYANPPVKFVENKNQWPENIHYVSRITGGNMLVRNGGFSYVFLDQKHLQDLHERNHSPNLFIDESDLSQINGVTVNVNFLGSNYDATRTASGKSTEYYNFFIGNDPAHWGSEAYAFDTVTYALLYDDINMRVYGQGEHAKYDFILQPGGDPGQIVMAYEGADKLVLENGNLYAKTKLGDIIERKPYAYQLKYGKRYEVTCEFLLSGNELRFIFPEGYDPCFELVIDPLLIFSTYSGSAADNWGSAATPAEHGNLYSAGVTNHYVGTLFSGSFLATAGAFQTTYGGIYDIGILKYDSVGSKLLYASYLGGMDSESAHSLVVNKQNELLLLGTTSSTNFPVSANAVDKTYNGGTFVSHVVTYNNGSDIIVSRISPDGRTLLASTYLGGSDNDGINDNVLNNNYGDHLRGDIISDDEGNIYLSSVTASSDFVNAPGFKGGESDAVLIKLPSGLSSITWVKFIGGSGTDAAHTLKLDAENNIYTAGGTSSLDFPVTANVFQGIHAGDIDGWVAKLDNNGNILSSTYTGTVSYDQTYFLDLNKSEEVYVYGQTSGQRPVTPGVYTNPNSGQFIQKFSNDLSKQEFYTVFGTGKGTPDISPTAFMVSDCNYIYVAGWGGVLNSNFGGWNTATFNMPVTSDALQTTTFGHDFYFMVLSDDAKDRLYATFLGGNQSRTHVDGGTSRFEKSGIVYHAVCSGCRSGSPSRPSSDFPTTPGAFSRTNNSENCNNLAFKLDLSSLRAILSLKGEDQLCIPAKSKVELDNLTIGGKVYTWTFGDGSASITRNDRSSVDHTYEMPGIYTVWLKAIDAGTCKVRDSTSIKIYVYEPKATFPADGTICLGNERTLTASGGANYTWSSDDGKYFISGPDNSSITVEPSDSTLFYVDITEASGCTSRDSAWVYVIPTINPDFEFKRTADCSATVPELGVINLTDSLLVGDLVYFDFGDGTTSDQIETVHRYEKGGVYNVKVVARREFCVTEKVVSMAYAPLLYPNVITPGVEDDKNDVYQIQFGEQEGKTPLDYGFNTELSIYDRWGKLVYENAEYQHDWNASDVAGGVYYYQVTIQDHATCKGWLHVIK